MYQKFLERRPQLIPREFIQNHGLHCDLIFSKLKLGSDYTTDFFYLAKSSADWNCVFVEIEKPYSQYFVRGTDKLHSDFVNALAQIGKWRAWLAGKANEAHLVDEVLRPIRKPLEENPCFYKFVLVHGRRSEYGGSTHLRRLIQANERDDFKIMSYDSLIDGVACNRSAYIASRKNSHIEILSTKFVSDQLFSVVNTNDLLITASLQEDIVRSKDMWLTRRSYGKLALEEILPKLQVKI